MGILDKVTKLEKRIGQLAARSDIAPQPLEIRAAILDEVEDQVQAGARGRRIFPFNRVAVDILAAEPSDRTALEAVLEGEDGLRAAVVERLRQTGCARVDAVGVKLRFLKKRPADWQPTRFFKTTCASEESVPAATVAVSAPAPAAEGVLVVVKGAATRKSFPLNADTTNIGRQAEVLDKERRVVRRNQVVFTADDDPVNDTVSRAHAHIKRGARGEFRLFDDHSSYGTRIFRSGQTIELPSGSPRGTRLENGDEIYVGRACLRIEVK